MKSLLTALALWAVIWAAGTACEICDCSALQGSGGYCSRCGHSSSYHNR